jgi:undecaprenyl-diphosphatase
MNIHEVNIALFHLINNFGKEFPELNPLFIVLAEYTVFFLALAVICFWIFDKKENRIMVISGGTAFVLAEILGRTAGLLFSNQQPFAALSDVNQLIEKAVDNSFPSDHTILFFSFTMTFFLFQNKFRSLWLCLACLVGISRIIVGVHYPFDILAGAGFAVLSAFASFKTVPNWTWLHTFLAVLQKWEEGLFASKKNSKNHHV